MRMVPSFLLIRSARAWRGALGLILIAGAAAATLAGCGGPRLRAFTDRKYPPLGSADQVEIYVGRLEQPVKRVAQIETTAYPYEDREAKLKQIAELRERARRLGANAVQEVRILPKKVEGYTLDERVPFPAWKQGKYNLFFMRGVAVRTGQTAAAEGQPAASTDAAPAQGPAPKPAGVDDIRPEGGWLVERLSPPPRLDEAAASQPAGR